MNEKWNNRFLYLAKHISQWSKDPSTQVGAVIVDENGSIVSMGYNGLARGVEDSDERLNNRELKYKMIVHAERNAIIFARKDLRGHTIYTWPFMPCAVCASMIIQAGINEVVSVRGEPNPRWEEDFKITEQMFEEAGVKLTLL